VTPPMKSLYPEQYTTHGFNPEGVPAEMRTYPAWVVWKGIPKQNGKLDKIPYTPGLGTKASTTDMRTWRSFEEAVAAYEAGGYDGVGFVFSTGDPFVGVDLDGGRDPESGELAEWAALLVKGLGGWADISPSGTGVHVIVKGELPEGVRHKVKGEDGRVIEAYGARRFFTVCGRWG